MIQALKSRIARLYEYVLQRPNGYLYPATFISGLITSYAMPPWSLTLCLFLGLSAFYIILHKIKTPKQGALAGFLFGFGFFLNGLEWIGNALLIEGNQYAWVYPLAICGLPTVLSLYYAIAAYIIKKTNSELTNTAAILSFICIFGLIDGLRGHLFTGFPWNLFAYSWSEHLPLLQLLQYDNVYFLNILSIGWAVIPAFIILNKQAIKKNIILTTFLILSIAIPYTLGSAHLSDNPVQLNTAWHATIVQPNIKQSEKWKRNKLQSNFDTLTSLSTSPIKAENNLIIWPETATSSYILQTPENKKTIATLLETEQPTYLITGQLNYKPDEGFSNEVILTDGKQTLNRYKKTKLVPFGEFIPFQKWIPLAPVTNFKGFGKGSGPIIYETPDSDNKNPLTYRALICYEIIFPENTQIYNEKYPQLIINVTNDAWYGDSPGPYQHFTHARFRAIESGLPVIRSANTGISAIIDPYGRIIDSLPINERNKINSLIPKPRNKIGQTPPTRNRLYLALLILGFASILYLRLYKRDKN